MHAVLGELTRKKKGLDAHKPFPKELAKSLEQWFRIELTYASNAIEGNTLTRQQTALVVEEGITVQGKSLREHQEAINHANAFDFIKRFVGKKRRDVTLHAILDLHRLILAKIDDANAGRFRTVSVRLRGSQAILPNAAKIPSLMEGFIRWLHQKNSDHPVTIAADAHYKLVSMHPFVDGNGRTARLLMNLLLMQEGYPPAIIRKEDREHYITSLEKGQVEGELTKYYAIIYEAANRSLDIYLEALEPERAFAATEKQRFYTTDELASMLKVHPESIRRYVRSGKLRAVKLGGKFIRIEKTDVERFITKLKT